MWEEQQEWGGAQPNKWYPCPCFKKYTSSSRYWQKLCSTWQLTSTILLTQVGEPPHISQTNREANLSQDVLKLAVPSRPHLLSIIGGLFNIFVLVLRDIIDNQWALLEGVVTSVLVGKQVFDWLSNIIVKLSLDGLAVFGHLINKPRQGWEA